jgi:cell division protein FtsI/penicillin-binding protein 2
VATRRSRDRRIAIRRGLAAGAIFVVLAGGAYLVISPFLGPSAGELAGAQFARLWQDGKYADMWAMLTPESQQQVTPSAFATAYQDAARTATSQGVTAGTVTEKDGVVKFPVSVDTLVWGPIRGDISFTVDEKHINWQPEMVFPGLAKGETLSRDTKAPPRGSIVDRKGDVLIEGEADARTSSLGSLAGEVGAPDDAAMKGRLYASGFPEGQVAGTSGLELVFEDKVHGIPGGTLMAGTRQLATAEPQPAGPVRTTLDAGLMQASVTGLAGRLGGVVVMDAKSGEVRAVAGTGLSDAYPPGSTFKIVTSAAALEAGVAKPDTEYPVSSSATIDGYELKNAHDGELCGGTMLESFAHSCNSVFAPIGVDVGADRLVEMAERFGLNQKPSIAGATESTIPKAPSFTSDLDVGATAIGQGQVLMTPLGLASVTQVIADKGQLEPPRLDPESPKPEPKEVVSPEIAKEIGTFMEAVVSEGTGNLAAIPGVKVAGKTGTAEVGLTEGVKKKDQPKDHAWFTAYAPANKPKLVVSVFIANAGFGGDIAAPVARSILEAGLGVAPQ